MKNLKRLPAPIALPLLGLATFLATRRELRCLLGDPHYVEINPHATCGCDEDHWAFLLPSGQRAIVIHTDSQNAAHVYGDPPEVAPILAAFGWRVDDPRLVFPEEPWTLQ